MTAAIHAQDHVDQDHAAQSHVLDHVQDHAHQLHAVSQFATKIASRGRLIPSS